MIAAKMDRGIFNDKKKNKLNGKRGNEQYSIFFFKYLSIF